MNQNFHDSPDGRMTVSTDQPSLPLSAVRMCRVATQRNAYEQRFGLCEDWYEGAPLGNGDLGVIVYGTPSDVQFTIGKNDAWHRSSTNPLPKPVATFQVRGADGMGVNRICEHLLDLKKAVLTTSAPTFKTRCYVHKEKNVIVLQMSGVKDPVEIILSRHTSVDCPAPLIQAVSSLGIITQNLPDDTGIAPQEFTCALAAILDGGVKPELVHGHKRVAADGPGPEKEWVCDAIRWKIDQDCALVISVATSRDNPDPVASVAKQAEELAKTDLKAFTEEHERMWEEFWSMSGVTISDQALEDMWYYYMYLLASASRPGAVAPGLYGPWIANDSIYWNGAYTTDYNVEQTFCSALSANHPELMVSYLQMLNRNHADARQLAVSLGRKGVAFAHDMFADMPMLKSGPRCCFRGDMETPFLTMYFWEYYKHTMDLGFLKDQGFPLLADTADFLITFLCKDGNGSFYLYPTTSFEHPGDTKRNGATSIAFTRYILKAVLEAHDLLGLEDDRAGEWRHALEHLPDYPQQQTQKGMVYTHCALSAGNEAAPPAILPAGADTLQARPSKRADNLGPWMYFNCPIPTMMVWPANQIDSDSPAEDLLTAMRTWTLAKNEGTNDLVMRHAAAARLGIDSYAELKEDLAWRRLGNNLYTIRLNKPVNAEGLEQFRYFQYWKNGLYLENCGLVVVINEMMLQSHNNVIKLFPSLNKDLTASFRNLRTYGGYLVSAACDRGFVTRAFIVPAHNGTCRVRMPWAAHCIRLEDGDGKAVAFRIDYADMVFEVEQDQEYILQPAKS